MSEPGMTIEIEDVLSSIRRLVSQDAPMGRPVVAARVLEQEAPEAECLVLTPALRVAEAAEDMDDSAEASAEPALTEAEVLLADTEAALAEASAVLDDAELALDEAWGQLGPEDLDEASAPDLDAGLARLETAIAKMESAVAESGVEFEPEQGHRFEAEGAAPLLDLPETFDAEAFAEEAVSSELNLSESAEAEALEVAGDEPEALWEPDAEVEGGEPADEADVFEVTEVELVASPAQDDEATVDPDLRDEAWAAQDTGMDWAEAALSLARSAEPRRLHVSDAEGEAPQSDAPRSSYEALREALEADESPLDEGTENLFDAALIDEVLLREMVAQLIREELRGVLGERITQNVRKLVRREIQRALMGQEFD